MAGIGTWAIAGALGATVLGIGAVASNPLSSAAAPEVTTSISTSSVLQLQEADGHEGPRVRMRGHQRGEHREAVAAALGVSVEELTAATQAVRESIEKPEPPLTAEQRLALRDELSRALAAELGLSQAAVEAAFDSVFEANLQAKVDEGKITEAEAAEIREARENGTLIELMRERRAERIGERLDGAVENGVLTEEQADALQTELAEGDREGFRELMQQFREDSGTFSPRGFRGGEGGARGGNGGGTSF